MGSQPLKTAWLCKSVTREREVVGVRVFTAAEAQRTGRSSISRDGQGLGVRLAPYHHGRPHIEL